MNDAVVVHRGVSGPVAGAALATAAGAAPGLLGLGETTLPTGALYGLGWPAFGIAAALLLDRDPRSRLGRALVALAVVPAIVTMTALGAPSGWQAVEQRWQRFAVPLIVAALAVIAWSVDIAADRMSRRRLVWLVAGSAALVAAVLAAFSSGGSRVAAVVTTLGLWGTAALICRLATMRELRPVDEPLVDAAVAAATLLIGAGVGTLVRIGGEHTGVPRPDVSGAFSAVVAAVLFLPAGLWLRRQFLTRRYGPGALSAADVAEITADLHTRTEDPRELLGKAAAMVAAASGHRQVGLVVGPDLPDVPGHWALYPLTVGGDRVGSLYLEPRHPEGPEPRQERIVRQLLPTVSLVAKAVDLAVEAGHARRDLARERDTERARILGDLHDGLGPVLVGMSMRVRAELRHRPSPVLEALAGDLADCRSDLRRIVSGLTPSVLDDGDLAAALDRLAGSFAGQGPEVTLGSDLDARLAPEIAVAVYRSVAEGLTNALRHAHAQRVAVQVRTTPDRTVLVEVTDDGVGGPFAPGVGLSSLRRRAEELGGTLHVAAGAGRGTRLRVELPAGDGAAG
ncbi:sensor histidine kinase [Actinoplanes aureus]|uniref:histidine kinase n=1 Tax=Actinoplanes aureus TaxID=2792083 RepID=A0A931CEN4_9ACTN|nr:sensor histidine kinase [Actinoplanes aureus]MBG0565866.1 sensor histidine kinase [Actinoplanes aureus]